MSTQFVDIGFSNFVEADKIFTVNRPDGAPTKRLIQHAKDNGRFLDLTAGKKTRSVIVQASAGILVVVASAVQTATVIDRIRRGQQAKEIIEKASGDIVETTSMK
jgi:extracellular matrix regulatory protein A